MVSGWIGRPTQQASRLPLTPMARRLLRHNGRHSVAHDYSRCTPEPKLDAFADHRSRQAEAVLHGAEARHEAQRIIPSPLFGAHICCTMSEEPKVKSNHLVETPDGALWAREAASPTWRSVHDRRVSHWFPRRDPLRLNDGSRFRLAAAAQFAGAVFTVFSCVPETSYSHILVGPRLASLRGAWTLWMQGGSHHGTAARRRSSRDVIPVYWRPIRYACKHGGGFDVISAGNARANMLKRFQLADPFGNQR